VEPGAGFLKARPGHLLNDLAVPKEHEGGPKFDLKRPSERFPFAILDLDVSDPGVLLEQSRQLRLKCAAVSSPLSAEFEENRALHLVDLLASRLPLPIADRKFGCHRLLLSSVHLPVSFEWITAAWDPMPLLEAYHCIAPSSNRIWTASR
jgi:hypothetical protein